MPEGRQTRIDWARVREQMASHARILEHGAETPESRARILRERAAKMAAASTVRQGGSEMHAVLFQRGAVRYAIDLARLQEILPCRMVTSLPAVPPFCLGVMNMRGEILAVFDVALLFSAGGAAQLPAPQRIVVVESTTSRIGIAADEVDDAVALAPEEIEPPLVTFSGPRARLVAGIARGALLLDCNALIDSDALVVG